MEVMIKIVGHCYLASKNKILIDVIESQIINSLHSSLTVEIRLKNSNYKKYFNKTLIVWVDKEKLSFVSDNRAVIDESHCKIL